jgi:TonB family protein
MESRWNGTFHSSENTKGSKESSMRAVRRTIAIAGLVLCLAGGTVLGQQPRKVLSNPTPVYPELAKKMHLSGSVKVTVTIGPDGKIKETEFHGGHPVLVDSVEAALKNWRYAPASSETTQLIEFKF